MPPAEAADMVQRLEKQDRSLCILDREGADVELCGFGVDVRQKFAVGEGSVGAELVQDFSQRGGGHGDLEEMIQKGDLLLLAKAIDRRERGRATMLSLAPLSPRK